MYRQGRICIGRLAACAVLGFAAALAPLGCSGEAQKFEIPSDPTPLPDPSDRVAPGGVPSTSRPMER